MIITEIINPAIKDVDLKNRQMKWRDISRDKDVIGTGMSAVVKQDKDPFMVSRRSRDVSYNQMEEDRYWKYAHAIIESKIYESNPFVPRFYEIKRYKNNKGNEIFKGKMEKLHPVEEISTDMLLAHLENISNFSMDLPDVKSFIGDYEYTDASLRESILRVFLILLEKEEIRGNKKLEQAMNFIDKLKANWDLHPGNVMFRIGGHGIQLVITDPIG